MTRTIGVILCCAAIACSKPSEDASSTANALRSSTSATGAAATDPVCKLYTSEDAAHYIGKPAKDGDLSMGGCQWLAADGPGSMSIQVAPLRYNEKPEGSPGYRVVPDVASDAFVATYMNGWLAGAVVGKDVIRVMVSGNGVNDATAIALLKETIKRRGAAQ